MKRVVLINQAKGGVGKSVLAFLMAEKYPEAEILDMDDASKTTSLQLAYREPTPITFLNSNRVIDRGLFSDFLEEVSANKPSFYIADLGASISEQLPHYFSDVAPFLGELLPELGIQLDLYVVVGGANIYVQTMNYLQDLLHSLGDVRKVITVTVLKNEYYEFSSEQQQLFNAFVKDHKLAVHNFDISRDKNESTQLRIKEVLKSGRGINSFSSFSKFYFTNAIKQLPV